MIGDKHRVDRPSGDKTFEHCVHGAFEEGVIHRSGRLTIGDDDRHWLPGAGGIHGVNKSAGLHVHPGNRLSRLPHDDLSLEVTAPPKVRFGRDRGKRVALQHEAENGDPRWRAVFHRLETLRS